MNVMNLNICRYMTIGRIMYEIISNLLHKNNTRTHADVITGYFKAIDYCDEMEIKYPDRKYCIDWRYALLGD